MDNSRWLFNKLARLNAYNNIHHNACDGIDLTLRLGLSSPDCDQNPVHNLGQDHVIPACIAPSRIINLSFPGPNTQGMNQLGMVNQGAMVNGQQSLNGTQYAWPCNQMTSNIRHMNYANAFNQFSGPSLGFPTYNTSCYNNFAPTSCCPCHHHQLPPPNPEPTNNYTLLDVPPRATAPRSHQQELGSTAASSSRPVKQNKRGLRRQRGGNNNDPNKRCTNYNCNTNNTPTWRRGPLGPTTLCNACGIKYRKEEEKRKAREAGSKGQ